MATIKDVAKEAGVSPAAVSRILNRDETMSAAYETKQRVFQAAEKLGYTKNRPFSKSSFVLGIVQWFSAEQEKTDSYYLSVRQGIEDFCTKNAIQILRTFKTDADFKETLKSTDGIICIGKFSEEEVEEFKAISKNIVFLDLPFAVKGATTVSLDFGQAMGEALDYLFSLGHTRIGFVGGQEYIGDHLPVEDGRKKAYQKYLKKKNLLRKEYIRIGDFSTPSGYALAKELLALPHPPTAIFAASDIMALGVMKAIQEAGLSIPADISVIGFDDMEFCSFTTPALTTIHAPAYDMGQHGANFLYVASNLSIQTPLRAKLPCYLVERESCKRLGQDAVRQTAHV